MSQVRRIADEQRRWRLAHRHRLLRDRRTDDVADIASDLVGLHASDPATVFLSCFVRMQQPSVATVNQALYEDQRVVRHHAMRRTMWVMTPEIARLAHGAATAKIAKAERKRTLDALADTTDIEDPEQWLDTALHEIRALIAERGPLTTRAIGQALPHLVVPMQMGANTKSPATLNAHTKVLQGAGFDATLVRAAPNGDWTSSEYAWSPVEDWVGGPLAGLDESPAASELLGHWLRQFGPTTETDIRWWFGWTATLARAALSACDAQPVALEDGDAAWLASDDPGDADDPGPWVRLLPGLDPTMMGWKQRDWYVDARHSSELFDRFGNAGPTIWADGRVVGAWGQDHAGSIRTGLVEPMSDQHQRLLDDAVAELEAAVDSVVVRPRFPAPLQRSLADS